MVRCIEPCSRPAQSLKNAHSRVLMLSTKDWLNFSFNWKRHAHNNHVHFRKHLKVRWERSTPYHRKLKAKLMSQIYAHSSKELLLKKLSCCIVSLNRCERCVLIQQHHQRQIMPSTRLRLCKNSAVRDQLLQKHYNQKLTPSIYRCTNNTQQVSSNY